MLWPDPSHVCCTSTPHPRPRRHSLPQTFTWGSPRLTDTLIADLRVRGEDVCMSGPRMRKNYTPAYRREAAIW